VILRKRVAGLSESMLSRFVTRASRAAKLRGEVNVLVTTGHELRTLNRRFRKQDKTTDVLSFPPMLDSPEFAGISRFRRTLRRGMPASWACRRTGD